VTEHEVRDVRTGVKLQGKIRFLQPNFVLASKVVYQPEPAPEEHREGINLEGALNLDNRLIDLS
jgi:hypothetical protein